MKQRILIGPMNRSDVGSIPILNRAFTVGLKEEYDFIPLNVSRKYGKSKVSNFNITNLGYFILHYLVLFNLLKNRPKIFHYAITSNWNFEKSLLFLKTAKFLGVSKTVGHLHGGAFDIFMSNIKDKRKKRVIKWMSSLDVIIVASKYWKSFLEEQGVITLIQIVNNPIDTKYVSTINQKSKVERNNRFLFVGALGKRKGFYDIINASKKADSNFLLDAIGSEDRQNDLIKINELINENEVSSKINIVLSEKMKLDEKVNYFSKSGVFLFPSHNENFPLVIIEAACAGMPIISTKVGAIPEFFEHMKNIYFIEPGNIEQIEDAINYMINNPDKAKQLGLEARNVYEEELSEKIVMGQLDSIYKNII